jgi:TPR repeat protein
MNWSWHDLKVAPDQGIPFSQYQYGNCLQKGEAVGLDFKGTIHYFRLAADQGDAVTQNNYGFRTQKSEDVSNDF